MKVFSHLVLVSASVLALVSCADTGTTSTTSTPSTPAAPAFGQPLTSETGPGTVTIKEGSKVLATFKTEKPNVEQTRWYSEQEQIVVKSRGNHGPASVQLFNSRTGQQLGSVMAYEAANGPAWAKSMAE